MDSEIPKKNILITGACGYVGNFLIKKLSETSYAKLVLNCRNADNQNIRSKNVIYTSVNLDDKVAIEKILKQYSPETIIHLAALARLGEGEKKPDEAFQTNVITTKNLIEIASLNQVKTFLFVSSDLTRPPVSVVGITKYLVESTIQNSKRPNLKQIIIRLPNVSYSPGSVHLIFERQIEEAKALTITHPNMTRRFISCDEAATFILIALNSGKNKDIFVIDKKPEKIVSLANNLIKTSGKHLPIEIISSENVNSYHEVLQLRSTKTFS